MRYELIEKIPKSNNIALLDADIFAFRIAVNKKQTEEQIQLYGNQEGRNLDNVIEEFYSYLRGTISSNDMNIDNYIGFFSSKSFRRNITNKYKANREGSLIPEHLSDLKKYLVDTDTYYFVDGYEADDALATYQTYTSNTFIMSTDKDLLQIPGYHYNFVKKECYYISEDNANYNLWYQMLVGDTADNIKYLVGIGPKKAEAILAENSSGNYMNLVLNMFINVFGLDEGLNKFTESFNLLYLKRDKNLIKDNYTFSSILDLHNKSIKNEGKEENGTGSTEYF